MSNSEPSTVRDLPMSSNQTGPVGEIPTAGSEQNPIREAIEQAIGEHKVILFMKGTPEAPACGFSARTVAALQALDAPFAAVDILPDPRIRQELSAISDWPTIPQLFVGGEFIGGCDIVCEMYESGELAAELGLSDATAEAQALAAGAPSSGGFTQIENRL
jgi:monothiol glutaredoxin